MTPDQLRQIMPSSKKRADVFAGPLTKACEKFEINTPQRLAMFIAQIAHESGQLLYVRELASGQAYEGRTSLGNTEKGDGVRYKGRGLIQITGRANYAKCQAALGIPCVAHPEMLETPENASLSAAWFWKSHGLNDIADRGDFLQATKVINGGIYGLQERIKYWEKAKTVFGA